MRGYEGAVERGYVVSVCMRVCMYKRDRERGEVTGARVSEEKGQQIPSPIHPLDETLPHLPASSG